MFKPEVSIPCSLTTACSAIFSASLRTSQNGQCLQINDSNVANANTQTARAALPAFLHKSENVVKIIQIEQVSTKN